VFAGGVVQTVLDGTIKNVADRGGQVNGIVQKAEQRTEQEAQLAASEAARVEASVARALKGDSQALKKSLEAAGQEVPQGYAAHHLIPSHLVDEHQDMFEAAAKNGFSINAAENGWALPRTKELAKELELPLHSGNHLDSYYDAASSELNALQEAYRAGKVTSSQLPGRLNEISAAMKQKLQDLELFLQKTDPRYPK